MSQARIDLSSSPLSQWNGPLGLPDFSAFDDTAFEPAFDAALVAHAQEIEAIAKNSEPATIDNTLRALELAGDALTRISSIFWCRAGAHTNEQIQGLERRISPKMSRHFSAIAMNDDLFARIDALYADRERLGLDAETDRVLEKTWKGFVRSGAKLQPEQKTRLAAINERLALLGAQFGQNVLADEKDWALVLEDGQDLAGLPEFLKTAMAEAAETRGHEGKYALTLSRSIFEPFMTLSDNRPLREKAFRAFTMRGQNGGEADNVSTVAETLALRNEKAGLLGYENYAAFKLDDTMAKSAQSVLGLLQPVWEKALERANEDQQELQRLAAADGQNHAIAAWDWRYYADRLRTERFDFDEAEIKPYLQLENIIAACFDVATRLFGIEFEEKPGVRAWHPDARVFEVKNRDGSRRGVFAADYFARPSKRSGAWMSALQSGHRLGDGSEPIIYNIMNFAKPPKGEPALLSFDEAKTLFHEFGHALHGLLTEVNWPSVSGTSVSRDFVELPSQLYEHWLTVPDILKEYAVHYQTGESIPAGLLEKVLAAQTFDAGFGAVEFTASALVDIAFHTADKAPVDPIRFESETLAGLNMPNAIAMRHRTPHFAHVFAGDGYSAGYYSYMWSEVLDADAFAAFEEAGNPFDPELADKLRRHIYSAGGTADPEKLYMAFRGRMPKPDAMMKKRGLVSA